MKTIIFMIVALLEVQGVCHSSYSGHLGKSPITMVMYHYSDGDTRAYYVYDRFDTPITINGRFENKKLTLFEHARPDEISATLIFPNFNEKDRIISGRWVGKDKTYKISLKKDFDLSYGDDIQWENRELLQSQSTKNHYFKTIISKEKGRFYGSVVEVKIYEKKTDKLIQTIKLNGQLFGIDSVSVGDYNFDGIEDFSVFESSYSGPNTSRIYILKDPNSDKYIVSDFQGTSLYFDNKTKLIYEHNQCCAGRSHINTTYKVVNNKMILVDKRCIEYSDKEEDFLEVKCEN